MPSFEVCHCDEVDKFLAMHDCVAAAGQFAAAAIRSRFVPGSTDAVCACGPACNIRPGPIVPYASKEALAQAPDGSSLKCCTHHNAPQACRVFDSTSALAGTCTCSMTRRASGLS